MNDSVKLDHYWESPRGVAVVASDYAVSVSMLLEDGSMPGFVLRVRDGKLNLDLMTDGKAN